MKCYLHILLIAAALPFFGRTLYCTSAEAAAATSEGMPSMTESEATTALERMGIPMHRSPEGQVRWIEAPEGQFSDAALALLPELPDLEWLEIGSADITPSGLAHLKRCTALKRLYIHDIRLGSDLLRWLSSLPRLEAVSLQRTGITAEALKNLTSKSLTVLNLSGNPIGDEAMGIVSGIRQLEVLALADTKVTGMGIAKLEGMPRLNDLNLMRCAINDADLHSFLTMPNLRIVQAAGCAISDMAVYGIIARFPMLAIFR